MRTDALVTFRGEELKSCDTAKSGLATRMHDFAAVRDDGLKSSRELVLGMDTHDFAPLREFGLKSSRELVLDTDRHDFAPFREFVLKSLP